MDILRESSVVKLVACTMLDLIDRFSVCLWIFIITKYRKRWMMMINATFQSSWHG